MSSKSQARLEFRLDVCFKQLLQAADLSSDYGDPHMADDLTKMAWHIKSMMGELLDRRAHRGSYLHKGYSSENK